MKPTPLTLTALLLSASSPAISCQVQTNWKITFFGYPDNSPPSGDIAFDCGRGFAAGGDGSLNDPVTMAAAYNVFAKCEVIYIPYLKKYARYEDYCGQCGKDQKLGLTHIDIWTGSTEVNGGLTQERCEETLTRTSKRIVRNPDSGLEVDTNPLFSGGNCGTNAIHDDSGISPGAFCGGSADAGSSSFSVATNNIDQSANTFPLPNLDDATTIPTPSPAAPNGGNENVSPGDISSPQWGDFVPTTNPVAGQLTPPAAAGSDLSLQANGITPLPTSEKATPIDSDQQTTSNDDLFASIPTASGQNENGFNLAAQGGELASAPSADFSDAAGEIPPSVLGLGEKLRVRRNGGKWRAVI